MEWISFKDSPPENDILALVCNEKGFLFNVRAMYHKRYDIWVLNDPNYRETLALEVTHYFPIPDKPVKLV